MATLTTTQLNKYMIKSKISEEDRRRFGRIASLYNFDSNNSDIIKFLTMVIDDPCTYKNNDKILQIWKKKKSISDVFLSITRACRIQEVKDILGDRFESVTKAHEDYIKELQMLAQERENLTKTNNVVIKQCTTEQSESDNDQDDQDEPIVLDVAPPLIYSQQKKLVFCVLDQMQQCDDKMIHMFSNLIRNILTQ